MSGNARKRRSTWDNKEENQIAARTSEQNSWQERESYPRRDPKLSDNDADYALKSKDFHEWPNRELSPRKGQRDDTRDSHDASQSRSVDVEKSYNVSPRNHGLGQQNHIHSPEGTWDPPHRSRSRSRGRGKGRSRSPSRGRNRSRSLNRGKEREVGYGRSRSPPNDYNRREPRAFSERRSGFREPPPQVCRNFTAGDCRRGSQCRFLHPDNPYVRDGGRSERDQLERRGTRAEHVGSRYDLDREVLMRNFKTNVCNNFLIGRCRMGSSCRYSHHDAGGDSNDERQPHIAPCKFFLMGNCSRNDCRFSHDPPTHNAREVEQCNNDRWDRDYGEKNNTWNETEKRDHGFDVKHGGRNGPTWHDVAAGGSEVTHLMIAEKENDDKMDHSMEDQSKMWAPPREIDDMDMDLAGSDAPKEINKKEPKHKTTYEFSTNLDASDFKQHTSTVAHSVFPETSQLYNSNTEGNLLTAHVFDYVNSGDIYVNAMKNTSMPVQNFNQNTDIFGLPPQHFGGISQDQLVNSINPTDDPYIDLSSQAQEKIFQFEAQNSIDTQYGPPVINHSMSQAINDKPVQISNLPASLTEKFVNEQLPQLYAVLNPPKPKESMSSVSNLIHARPDQTSIYQKRDVGGIERQIPDNSVHYPGFSSNSIAQNGASVNNNHISSELSQKKTEEPNKPINVKFNLEPENNGAGDIEADAKVGDGANWKDEKAMRLFKNSLVEFVKDILKPKWKEGQMSRNIHKSIVKKVVDKVTSATQGINIPSTQAKLDQYLQTSKPKLAKLIEAYMERFAKAS